MKFFPASVVSVIWLVSPLVCAASTGEPFYGDPPDDHHPWCVHDWNRPQPPRVAPGPLTEAKPPADAVVLFDGSEGSLTNWEADKAGHEPTKWRVQDGAFLCVPKSGFARTVAKFGDCRVHVEWAAPTPPTGESQGRGNSGIFLMDLVEIQVLDNYDNPTYADGFANAIYGENPPLANPLRPPGQWQQVDIEFRRPVYKDGQCTAPGIVTVFCNGVLVQDHAQIEGPTGHMRRSVPGPLPDAGPLALQDHGNPVRFRNIWYEPLPPRTAADVAKQGPLSTGETMAKREQIAGMVRDSAQKMPADSVEQMLRLAESLVYANDDATYKAVEQWTRGLAASVKQLPDGHAESKTNEVTRVVNALGYLTKFKIIPADDPAWTEIRGVASQAAALPPN